MTERDGQILFAYKLGHSLRQVAKTFKVSHERVRQILKREGFDLRSRSQGVRLRRQGA